MRHERQIPHSASSVQSRISLIAHLHTCTPLVPTIQCFGSFQQQPCDRPAPAVLGFICLRRSNPSCITSSWLPCLNPTSLSVLHHIVYLVISWLCSITKCFIFLLPPATTRQRAGSTANYHNTILLLHQQHSCTHIIWIFMPPCILVSYGPLSRRSFSDQRIIIGLGISGHHRFLSLQAGALPSIRDGNMYVWVRGFCRPGVMHCCRS